MGCSYSEQHVVQKQDEIPGPPLQKELLPVFENLQNINIIGMQMPVLYIFGQKNNESCILRLELQTSVWSVLQKPLNMVAWNYSSCVYLTINDIFISGGINASETTVVNHTFIYNPVQGIAYRLPDMLTPRYKHCSIYYNSTLYVFSGFEKPHIYDGKQQFLTNKCEFYNFQLKEWTQIADMPAPRSGANCLVYKQEIYLFAGQLSNNKQTRNIEKYTPKNNLWQTLKIKLISGLDSALILPCDIPNEFIMLGGVNNQCPQDKVVVYDLFLETVHYRPSMQDLKLEDTKGYQFQGKIYVLNQYGHYICCDQINWKWESFHNESWPESVYYMPHQFSIAAMPIWIAEANTQRYINEKLSNIVYLFGTDTEPFIMEFNMSTGYALSKPVPMQMRLFSEQQGARIGDGIFFLCGGLSHKGKEKGNCYIYDVHLESGRKVKSMLFPVFNHALTLHNNCIYVMGGQVNTGQNVSEQTCMTNQCQKYNIAADLWEELPKMTYKRQSAAAFSYNNKIYVFGGYSGKGVKPVEIEVLNDTRWDIINYCLPHGIESASFIQSNVGELMIFGARLFTGDTNKVFRLTIKDKEFNEAVFEEVGKINEPRRNSKIYYQQGQLQVIVFGGNEVENCVQFYNLQTNQVEQNEQIQKVAKDFEKTLMKLEDPNMHQYALLYL